MTTTKTRFAALALFVLFCVLATFTVSAFVPPHADTGSHAAAGEAGTAQFHFGGRAVLRDGTYTGTANGFRKTITVRVTVAKGAVAAIQTLSSSDTPAYYNRMENTLSAAITNNQTLEVDAVSGATRSSNGYKNAVRDALTKAVIEGAL